MAPAGWSSLSPRSLRSADGQRLRLRRRLSIGHWLPAPDIAVAAVVDCLTVVHWSFHGAFMNAYWSWVNF